MMFVRSIVVKSITALSHCSQCLEIQPIFMSFQEALHGALMDFCSSVIDIGFIRYNPV